MKRILSLLTILMLFASCAKTDTPNRAIEAVTYKDVAYGSDDLQKMDIYLPADRNSLSTKVLILIHGGGWEAGDKADFNGAILDSLMKNLPDYAVLNINYRLNNSSSNHFPTQENDIKEALSFIDSKRLEYAVSDKTVLLGASAGAHLALLQAFKNNNGTIKAVVSLAGPTDLVKLYDSSSLEGKTLVARATGSTPSTVPEVYKTSSPINYVSAQSVPAIIFQGAKDLLVPQSQATMLADTLQALKVPFEKIIYPQAGHGWGNPELSDTYQKIKAFLNKYNP